MADNLPAKRETRFPDRQQRKVVYANVTDAGGDRPPPRTQYIDMDSGDGGGSRGQRTIRWTPGPHKSTSPPSPLPHWLGNQRILGYAWLGSMIVIAFDEWKNNGILPRPSRLWYTSLTFGILMVVSLIDPFIPLMNALGIGFFIMLLWQYFNGTGQFA